MMYYNVSSKKERRAILAGLMLGDGGRTKNNFYIGHSMKQKDYALFKSDLLQKITGKEVNIRERTNKLGYSNIRVEPKLIPLTKRLVRELWKNGEKKISRNFLNYLSLESIAIWFMDDGSKSFKKRNGKVHAVEVTLNTYLSKEDNEIIIHYFKEVWGIKWGLNKSKSHYRLRMGTREARKFFKLISPYIIPSMQYKINLTY